jgi:tetratricopeptide (TPR) repeat protein
MAELFDFQDRIVEAVVGRIEPEVRRAEIERARRKRPENLDAYDLYLRALPYFRGVDLDARAEAVRLLEGAIALDPGFATALAYGAWAYDRHEMFGADVAVGERATMRARALELAERAIAVGHDDPQVMAIAAMVLIFIGQDWLRGLAMLDDAQRANPNNPTVLSLFGIANVLRGNLQAGRAAYLRALAISPTALDNFELLWGVALSYMLSGEYEAAIDWALRSLAVNPDWLPTYWTLASAYAYLDRLEEGYDMIARLLAKSPAMRISHIRNAGEHEVVLEGLRKAGMPD